MLSLQHSNSIIIRLFENNIDSSRSQIIDLSIQKSFIFLNREYSIVCIASVRRRLSLITWRNAEVIISTATCSRYQLIMGATVNF